MGKLLHCYIVLLLKCSRKPVVLTIKQYNNVILSYPHGYLLNKPNFVTIAIDKNTYVWYFKLLTFEVI